MDNTHLRCPCFWTGIWKLKVPPKIENLIWRICRGIFFHCPFSVQVMGAGAACGSLHDNSNKSHFLSSAELAAWFSVPISSNNLEYLESSQLEALAEWTWSMRLGCGPCSAHHGRMHSPSRNSKKLVMLLLSRTHQLLFRSKCLYHRSFRLDTMAETSSGSELNATLVPHFRPCRYRNLPMWWGRRLYASENHELLTYGFCQYRRSSCSLSCTTMVTGHAVWQRGLCGRLKNYVWCSYLKKKWCYRDRPNYCSMSGHYFLLLYKFIWISEYKHVE